MSILSKFTRSLSTRWVLGTLVILILLLFLLSRRLSIAKEHFTSSSSMEHFADTTMTLLPSLPGSLPIYFNGLTGDVNQSKLPYVTKVLNQDAFIFPKSYTMSDSSHPMTYFTIKQIESGRTYEIQTDIHFLFPVNTPEIPATYLQNIMDNYSVNVFFTQDYKQYILPIVHNWNMNKIDQKTLYTMKANVIIPNWFKSDSLNIIFFYTPNIADMAFINMSVKPTLVPQGNTIPSLPFIQTNMTWLNVAKQIGDTVNEYQWTNEMNPSQFVLFKKGPVYNSSSYVLMNGTGEYKAFDTKPYIDATSTATSKGFTIGMYVRGVEDIQTLGMGAINITEQGIVIPKMLAPFIQLNNPLLTIGSTTKNYMSIEFPTKTGPIKIQFGNTLYTTTNSYVMNEFRLYYVMVKPDTKTLSLYRDRELLHQWVVPTNDITWTTDIDRVLLNPFGRPTPGAMMLQFLGFLKTTLNTAELEQLQTWNNERLSILYQYTMSKWGGSTNQTFTELSEPISSYLNKQYAKEIDTLITKWKSMNVPIVTPTSISTQDTGATSISSGQVPPVPPASSTSPGSGASSGSGITPLAPTGGQTTSPTSLEKGISDVLSIFQQWTNAQLANREQTQQAYMSPETISNYQTCYKTLINDCYNTRNFQQCYQTFKEQNQDTCKDFFNMVQDDKCPNASYRDGKYWIYYPALKQWKSISTNQDYARLVYTKNFPNCSVPKSLQKQEPEFQETEDMCPYYFNDRNPCLQKECESVSWKSAKDILKAPAECKREIVHYCETYKDTDPNCICWTKEYENKPSCIAFRKKMGDRRSVECKPTDFSIEDHPDFSKYIQKDKIPCWGCNVGSGSK